MAQLPKELIEEILSRVPPLSLVRFKTVSKKWNTLLNNKTFIKNHKDTFRFNLSTKSKMYSVNINPKIEVRELTLDIPGLGSMRPNKLVDGNELILCEMNKGILVWNPWLRQTRWCLPKIKRRDKMRTDIDQSLQLDGLGYNNDDNRRVYKILAIYKSFWRIGGVDSNVWKKLIDDDDDDDDDEYMGCFQYYRSVSLDGSLYWVASKFHIDIFDFSTEIFDRYCDLPCGNNHSDDALVLGVFEEDRLSLLKQCHVSKKIEIWVTKNKILKSYGKDVEWIHYMEVSIPNLAYLEPNHVFQLSYFVEDKRLVVCSTDETRRIWIYVFGDKKLISKTELDDLGVDLWPLHCTYIPSLVSVPRGRRKKMELN